MISTFTFAQAPFIYFGKGEYQHLPKIIENQYKKVLLLRGGKSFEKSGKRNELFDKIATKNIAIEEIKVSSEPSPELVDTVCEKYRPSGIDAVVAIGGGSVLDAGKAISAMLPDKNSVMDYLEGVGKGLTHTGKKVPFIAVPTTSGTGSEATKNAVLSNVNQQNGFKKSLRHDNFVPDIAIVDPELTLSCSQEITAVTGMDAFTQLLESYLSANASPMTDSLAFKGLSYLINSLLTAYNEPENIEARTGMSFASHMGGITLANAGLGLVHGFASPIGGFFDIPHGVVCGTLMAEINKKTLDYLLQNEPANYAIEKYASVGKLLTSVKDKSLSFYCYLLIEIIEEWTEKMNIPCLAEYGITENDLEQIIMAASHKNHPVKLPNPVLKQILLNRL